MQRRGFEEAVDLVVSKDPRYDRDAYTFLRESLEFTLKNSSSRSGSDDRHVSGQELMEGFRDFALQEFGPMAVTVFDEWGIRTTQDIGSMVFNLVEVGAFGKTEDDKLEDFQAGYDFHETFEKPFLPKSWATK
ncbi:Minf_1886 family protein [Sulfuriroseicoccus oceanibius]|uniref:Uncharacterized protein n=1 Tax=Sulfuriroseicoccus oceanibius TaxID=2707525 RepID=A0A6B3L7F5_9BACT|nr:Minf_1886 family protein [Sulfuriroseicoccus oceanibius]QQL43924.1 hypothetical protein G3M56_008440 [Sulfuriroseicoccus oceanibius]